MTTRAEPLLPRAVVVATSAATAVLAFLVMAMATGNDPWLAPTPAGVIGGAVVLSLVAPPVQRVTTRWVHERWLVPAPQPAVVLGAALAFEDDSKAFLEQLAGSVRLLARASSVTISSSVGDVTAGDPSAVATEAELVHGGVVVGRLEVTDGQELPNRRATVTELAATLAPAVAKAVALAALEQRRQELERIVASVQEHRHAMVVAEAHERERLAQDVVSQTAPLFDRLRTAALARDHDAAARTCETLIEVLRNCSATFRRG